MEVPGKESKRGAIEVPGKKSKRGAMEVPGMESKRGDGKLSGDGGVEYPCVRRLRHRRLIAYLWRQGFKATHRSMVSETDAVFSVRRMQEFVLEGKWGDAYSYLSRFLPANATFQVPFSVAAQVLHRFVAIHKALDDIVVGTGEGDSTDAEFKHYLDHSKAVPYCVFRLRSIIFSVVNSRQLIRTSFDLERVRSKASAIISDLVYQTPELNDQVFVPRSPLRPLDVLPIGFGFGRRSSRNKQARRPPASAVAKVYLGKKKISVPPSSSQSQESVDGRLSTLTAIDLVADILDESFKAGIRPELHHTHPVQTSKQGAAAARVSTMLATVPRMTPVANAGSKTMSETTTAPVPRMPSVANTGIPVAQVAETTKFTSRAENPESVQQGFNSRKNPREEVFSSDKQYVSPKRQRSAEDSGEASLISGAGGSAGELVNLPRMQLDYVFV